MTDYNWLSGAAFQIPLLTRFPNRLLTIQRSVRRYFIRHSFTELREYREIFKVQSQGRINRPGTENGVENFVFTLFFFLHP